MVSDPRLRVALGSRLAGLPGFHVLDRQAEPEPGSVVVAPVGDCPPSCCAKRVTNGMRVVILAPVFRESERSAYLAAGATAYLPMNLDLVELTAAIRATTDGSAAMRQ